MWIESRQNLTQLHSIREACFEKSIFPFLLNYSIPSLSVLVSPTNFSLYPKVYIFVLTILNCLNGKESTRQCRRCRRQAPRLVREDALEGEMATHSSVLALRIPGMGKPGWAAVYGVAQSQTRLKRLSSSSSSSSSVSYMYQV